MITRSMVFSIFPNKLDLTKLRFWIYSDTVKH